LINAGGQMEWLAGVFRAGSEFAGYLSKGSGELEWLQKELDLVERRKKT
jgi:hypothetical protein